MAKNKQKTEQNAQNGLGTLIIGRNTFTIYEGPTSEQILSSSRYERKASGGFTGFKVKNGESLVDVKVSQGFLRSITHGYGRPVFELEGDCHYGKMDKAEPFRAVEYRPKS